MRQLGWFSWLLAIVGVAATHKAAAVAVSAIVLCGLLVGSINAARWLFARRTGRDRMNRRTWSCREEPDGRLRLSGRCVVTGKPYSVIAPFEGVIAYFVHGRNIAESFPTCQNPKESF